MGLQVVVLSVKSTYRRKSTYFLVIPTISTKSIQIISQYSRLTILFTFILYIDITTLLIPQRLSSLIIAPLNSNPPLTRSLLKILYLQIIVSYIQLAISFKVGALRIGFAFTHLEKLSLSTKRLLNLLQLGILIILIVRFRKRGTN